MVRFLLSLAVLALCVSPADAGPFRRTTRSVTTTQASACVDGQCGAPASTATVRQRTVTVARGGGAQAHAEAMAQSGRLVHASAHGNTYEGIGCGGSPEAALSSCCNNGGTVLEEGTAYGHGRWFACRRYSLR